MKTYWMDKDVDTLSRDEAIEALKMAAKMLEAAHENTRSAWSFNHALIERKRR